MFIVDAHLDLAYNAIKYGRDLRRPVAEIRQLEQNRPTAEGMMTATLPALRTAGAGLVFGTLFVAPFNGFYVTPDEATTYKNQDEAHRMAMRQLDYYRRLADEVEYVRLVGDMASLEEVFCSHEGKDEGGRMKDEGGEDKDEGGRMKDEQESFPQSSAFSPHALLGIVPLMEGADPIREPEEAEMWYERGLRLVGPAWDDTRYSPGAWRGGGSLTKDGRRLLEVLNDFGFILDLTHMSEKASLEAMDSYEGIVVATHSNVRALVPGERHWSDTQFRRLVERGGVAGVVLYNRFLKAGWTKGNHKQDVTLDVVAAHIDHICQLAGDALHVGIGSDMDGGFGAADIPAEMDSAADLPLIGKKLLERGYAQSDVDNIMGGNWVRILRRAWT
jgi:membrane dipeptidase